MKPVSRLFFLALCVLLTLAAVPAAPVRAAETPVSVGYYGGWASYQGAAPDKLPAGRLTHINYAFADIAPSGRSLVLTDPDNDRKNFRQLRELKSRNPHLSTLISVGGWDHSTYFSNAASTKATREAFAQSCVDFIREHGFDGVDLDWEYPVSGGAAGIVNRPQDRQNFTLLLQALRDKLDAQGRRDGKRYLLTIAAGAGSGYLGNIEPKKVSALTDHIFLMSYDYHGPWDRYADLNAPLYPPAGSSPQYKGSVTDSVQAFLNAGVPADKLVLGMPFYGRLYQGVSSQNNGLYSTFSSSRSVTYQEIARSFLSNAAYQVFRQEKAQVPYLYGKNSFLSYDDPQSIAAKSITARSLGLRGFGAWELSQDDGSVLLDSAWNAWQSSLPFSDVLPGAWYYGSVAALWESGVMNGTSGWAFSPRQTLTRSMTAQILYNAEGRPASPAGVFADVPADAWYADAVNWAASSGLVNGYGNSRFGPGDPVTREQLAAMLYRFAQYRGWDTGGTEDLAQFADSWKISGWAGDSVSWAVSKGLLRGKGGGILDPLGRATRAEAAAMVDRFLQGGI